MRLIAALIDTTRFLSIDELHTRVGVSRGPDSAGYPRDRKSAKRAFHRDMNELAEVGIPVISGTVPGEDPPVWGYRIRKQDYSLPEMDLEAPELAALHRAATAVRFEGVSGAEALWKLGGRVGEGTDTELAAVPVLPALADLFRAVTEQRVAAFTYGGESRRLEPWTLAFDQGHWYVVGHDRDRGERRTFRIDRLDGDVALGPPNGFTQTGEAGGWVALQPWKFGTAPAVTAQLLVDSDQSAWAARRLGQEPALVQPDGSSVFHVAVRSPEAFRSLVLEFLDHAEVLGPPELRADMVAWLEQMS
ncbi:helix-turn-helix transcriptional regulator [Candidatus Poriferisocius sp.]|uniref:helix-turn-helix transcriptional regulator n=1 Tax=Candidatus Poriferisocius sp. TaxID=3101276 RepID=UPI003B5B00BB